MNFRINEREYSWGDGALIMLGRTVSHFTGIDYKETQEKEHLYAAGRNPRAIQRGKTKVEGTVTLLQSEVIALERAAKLQGYNSLLDLSIDLVMTYTSDSGVVTVDMIYQAEFTENPRSSKVGDMKQEIALPFMALSISHGV